MRDRPQSWTWPMLALVGLLFVLSVAAPRQWQRIARMQTRRPVERITSWRDRSHSARQSAARSLRANMRNTVPRDPASSTPNRPHADSGSFREPGASEPMAPVSAGVHTPEDPTRDTLPEFAATLETERDTAQHNAPRALQATHADETANQGPLDFPDDLMFAPTDDSDDVPASPTLAPSPADAQDSDGAMPGYEGPFATEVTTAEESAIDAPAGVGSRDAIAHDPVDTATDSPARDQASHGLPVTSTGLPDEMQDARPSISLESQLDRLVGDPASRQWGERVRQLIARWAGLEQIDGPQANAVLHELREVLQDSTRLIDEVAHRPQAGPLRRIQYHLTKRLDVWSSAHKWEASNSGRFQPVSAVGPDGARLRGALESLAQRLAGSPEAAGWRRYLLLDALEQMADNDAPVVNEHHRQIVRKVLNRLRRAGQSQPHTRFVHEPEMVRLAAELRNWVDQPLNARMLLTRVEQYEAQRLPSQAEQLALEIQRLRYGGSGDATALAERLEQHYRNCNIRLSIHQHFLDRLLPEQSPSYENVRETILGIPIRGRSFTTTEVHFRLIPDPHRARVALVASGTTLSRTAAYNEVATLRSRSQTFFEVEKPIEFRIEGLVAQPTRATANSMARLQDVETDFDGIPLVGWFVRNEVERQFHERRHEARREAERLVAVRASQRLDEQSAEPIEILNERLHQRVGVPLQRLGLDRPLTDFRTTQDRLTLRVRLASDDQLGAHTPRPQAPADSLLSVQIHESAINNCLSRLGLAGQTFVAPELQRKIAETLNFTPQRVSERDDIWLSFADDDPARVRCDDGRLTVILRLNWIQKDRRRWHDVEVRVAYRPDMSLPGGQFVRDGVVRLIGQRLGTRGQITLRSIFSNLFREDRTFRILPDRLIDEPRMADLVTTQLVVEDGWIATALASKKKVYPRTARQP